MALHKGFPTISPLVDILLILELTHGMLMGVQDYAAMKGIIIYDLAENGEGFAGMRSDIYCKANEIILRDNCGIVASYHQGSDKRTMIRPVTDSPIFFIFGTPNLEEAAVHEATESVGALMRPFAGQVTVKVLSPR